MENWYVNISLKHKYFVWTPERTGSTHCTNILTNLDFECGVVNKENQIIEYENKPIHNHYCRLIKNHLDYKFILTVRNPYAMMLSRIFSLSKMKSDATQKDIELKLEDFIQFGFTKNNCCYCFEKRTPDYFLRLENLYEDWSNIPFVKNHEYNTLGKLKEACNVRMNEQINTENPDYWKKYYNQRLADLVYYNYVNNFELFGYDKNSWKQ
jgi:hypothetical protein